jgi:DNA-binding MarR family transcriptional regulator
MSQRQADYLTDEPQDELRFRDPIEALGFTMVPNLILLSPELSALEKTVYSLLRYYARQNGQCFPGQRRLAERVPCTRQYVNRVLQVLQSFGLITIETRQKGRTNRYWIEPLPANLLSRVNSVDTPRSTELTHKNMHGEEHAE